jgi:hypothetical protein
MKYLLVLKSFSIRQSKELLFLFGINVDSEIDCLSMIGIIKAVSILTGRDTDFRKWSVEWPTNV